MAENKIDKIRDDKIKDWKVYIERRNSLHYVSIFNQTYGKLLQKEIGCSFKNQLYTLSNKVYTFYRSEKEIYDISLYFLDILKQKKELLEKIKQNCVKYEKIEEELLEKYKNHICFQVEDYEELMETISYIFLYLTTIPFIALDAISTLPEEKQILFKEEISFFTKFREKNRNPIQSIIFEQIWKKAAEIQDNGKIIQPKNNLDFYSYFTYDELGSLFKSGIYPSDTEIEKRKKGCIFYDSYSKIVFNYDANGLSELNNKFDNHEIINKQISEIKGDTACKGYAKGNVCIINHKSELKKFKAGDIIVSVNTNPTLMPALLKCKAIITDEGGLSCHASIISRELCKPCIVGTKIATKVLKDGDIIEVDANNGIVKRINE